jgi:putative flippase GtrA
LPEGAPNSKPTMADKARAFYDVHGEKLRFLVVGMWNTLFNVLLYNLILLAFGHSLYLVWFWVAWSIAVIQSTVTMKYFAFRRKGPLLPQIGRAYLIYLPAQGLSTAIMWLAVSVMHIVPPVAQLITIGVTTVFSYIGHKYFTFRTPLEVGEVPPEDMLDSSVSTH